MLKHFSPSTSCLGFNRNIPTHTYVDIGQSDTPTHIHTTVVGIPWTLLICNRRVSGAFETFIKLPELRSMSRTSSRPWDARPVLRPNVRFTRRDTPKNAHCVSAPRRSSVATADDTTVDSISS